MVGIASLYTPPDLGSADRLDDRAGARAVRAERSGNPAAAVALRADVFARTGSSGWRFVARFEHLRGSERRCADTQTGVALLGIPRIVPGHSRLLKPFINAPIMAWLRSAVGLVAKLT